ncbi:hypothetical protein IW262DRAFT_1299630 [Armillaria fumosa]|nr:hypothetical protein IW262DRAFT_1299630 [Armillaria fumosa]
MSFWQVVRVTRGWGTASCGWLDAAFKGLVQNDVVPLKHVRESFEALCCFYFGKIGPTMARLGSPLEQFERETTHDRRTNGRTTPPVCGSDEYLRGGNYGPKSQKCGGLA